MFRTFYFVCCSLIFWNGYSVYVNTWNKSCRTWLRFFYSFFHLRSNSISRFWRHSLSTTIDVLGFVKCARVGMFIYVLLCVTIIWKWYIICAVYITYNSEKWRCRFCLFIYLKCMCTRVFFYFHFELLAESAAVKKEKTHTNLPTNSFHYLSRDTANKI